MLFARPSAASPYRQKTSRRLGAALRARLTRGVYRAPETTNPRARKSLGVCSIWWKARDSNPGNATNVRRFSRPLHSTALPTFQFFLEPLQTCSQIRTGNTLLRLGRHHTEMKHTVKLSRLAVTLGLL